MAIYQVQLVNPEKGLNRIILVADDQYILDTAAAFGIELPSGCKQGHCSACVGKLLNGNVDQGEQKFLKSEELKAGYTVTCVAYPTSDCTILTDQESVLYKSSLYFKRNASKSDSE